jgi:hypothetical protein
MASINYSELTSYDDCVKRLGGRDSRKLRNNVYLRRDGTDVVIVHHATPIIRYRADGTIVLDCAGYRSATTKTNLNRYTGFSVWQKKGIWYISDGIGDEEVFVDGLALAGKVSDVYLARL